MTGALLLPRRPALAGVLLAGLLGAPAAAQPPAPQSAPITPAAAVAAGMDINEELESKKKAIESDPSLDEALRTQAAQSYGQAIATYQDLARVLSERDRLRQRIDTAPQRINALRESPAAPALDPPAAPPADTPSEVLQQQLRDAEGALQSVKRSLADQEDVLASLRKAASTLAADLADRRTRLGKIQSELAAPATAGTSPRLQESRVAALTARKALREAEIELFQQRLGSQDLLTELATLEREAAAAAVASAQVTVDAVRGFVQSRREAEAEVARAQAEAARVSAARLPVPIVALAAQNLALSRELEEVTKKGASSVEQRTALEARSSEISSDFAATRQRVEVVGSTAAIGRMLRRRHVDLPSLQGFRRAAGVRRSAIDEATDRQIDLDEHLRGLRDIESRADAVFAAIDSEARARGLGPRERIIELLTVQRDTIAQIQKAYGRYVTDLTALDVAERELVQAAEGFLEYIDEQLLWIQSIPEISTADGALLPESTGWLLSPSSWLRALRDLMAGIRDRSLGAAIGIVALLGVFLARRAARRGLQGLSDGTRRIRTDRFALTLGALAYTAAAAGAWPLLLAVLAWHLRASPTADGFSVSVSDALVAVAVFVFTLDGVRRACGPFGLGDRHFRWPDAVRQQVGGALRRFILFGTPLVFLVAMTTEFAEPLYMRGLGRPALVALMLLLLLFLKRLFGRTSAVLQQFDGRESPNRAAQLHFLWFPVLMAVPLVMAGMSLVGYHHSALQIEEQVRETAWLAIGLLFVREVILRMLYIAERRLRFEDLLKRRQEARAQRVRDGLAAEPSSAGEGTAVEEPEVDYQDLGHQAKRIVTISLLFAALAGLWGIWSGLLPALGILDNVTLPMVSRELVDGVERQVPVTLADLGMALLVLVGALFAAKNLTGLLEIAVLQRLPLDPGGRYAIVSLAKYAIVATGIITALARLGVEWSSIQWLVAALSVGLGFGLQEIVANFISGIILLLERPIRVGDIVTVGDTSGTVARIQIRATTIVNYDKQELLVPNKEFITGRVLNWTLTDQLNRLFINVGIAYESEVEKALEVLAKVAAEQQHVLTDPAPVVTFERFGDSSLELSLRCYLATLEFRLATLTELHSAIHRSFKAAGIAIAFPQRDLHIDTVKPIEVRMSV